MKVLPIISALSVLWLPAALATEAPAQPPKDGMLLWLKADAGVALDDSGRVKEWADQSGQGLNAVQDEPERRPLLIASAIDGKPALQFEARNTVLSTEPVAPPPQFSIFLVVSLNGQGYSHLIQWAPAGGAAATSVLNIMSGPKDGNGLYLYGDGGIVELTSPDLSLDWLESGAASLAEVIADGYAGTTTLLRNGEAVGNSDAPFGNLRGSGKPRPLHVGGATGGFPSANGFIAEVLIYEAALSDEVRQAVENYLAAKYGLSLAR
jgi:hypothetical protein